MLAEYPAVVKEAGDTYSPSCIANYIYELVREFNRFYHDYSILHEENEDVKLLRIVLSENAAKIIRSGLSLLGREAPERM
jgi:arginyl-tRNA synthetase